MGLDIGIMRVEYLERPGGIVYEFAEHMAVEGVDGAYMWGEGHSWIPFTQRHALRMLDDFSRERGLSPQEQEEVRAWLESLPWLGEGWRGALTPDDDGGAIELHFNW